MLLSVCHAPRSGRFVPLPAAPSCPPRLPQCADGRASSANHHQDGTLTQLQGMKAPAWVCTTRGEDDQKRKGCDNRQGAEGDGDRSGRGVPQEGKGQCPTSWGLERPSPTSLSPELTAAGSTQSHVLAVLSSRSPASRCDIR